MTASRVRSTFEIATIACFALALAAPSVEQLASDADSVRAELREPAPPPVLAWDAAALHAFPAAADAHVDDRFGFRHELIRFNNLVMVVALGVSPVENLTLGKDGWVFYDENESLAVGRGLRPFDTPDLAAWRCVLEGRRDWLAEHGVPYLLVVVPDKHSVHPEHLPDHLARVGPHTRLDQLLEYMDTHSDLQILDLRPTLAAVRRRYPVVYYPHGTHWNTIGAYVAFQALMEAVEGVLPDVGAGRCEQADFVPSTRPGESWGKRLHLEERFRTTDWALRDPEPDRWHVVFRFDKSPRRLVTEIPGSTLPRAMVFHDSFAVQWQPWLSQRFARVSYVWQRELDYILIAEEQPDILIQEMVERFILPNPSDGSRGAVPNISWTRPRVVQPHPPREPGPFPCPTPGDPSR